jgi:hypothetical protein
MAKNKTAATEKDVQQFINEFADTEQKRQDSRELIELMQSVTGHEPKMWGPSIVGFGSYHYKYDSGHEGDAPLLGFSPRKAAISLYVFTGHDKHRHLLANLGKFKMGKACIYVKKLADLDRQVLTSLMQETVRYLQLKYGI